ncbi:MAG: pyridoxal phosphate-dependent aminotransferase [Bradymonadaceae bacterium]
MHLSTLAEAIRPTQIRDFRSKAEPSSLDLGLGQSHLPVPEPVRRAAIDAIRSGRASYSDNLGHPETRRAIADDHGVDPKHVMVTCGVQEGLAVALLGLADDGDEVLVPDPGFPAYANLVRAAGADVVRYPLDPDDEFALASDAIVERLSNRTAAVVFNSPSNPTGRRHRREALEPAVRELERAGIPWISDEVYRDFTYGSAHLSPTDVSGAGRPPSPGLQLAGLSKSMHAMGWRLGWLVGPADTIERLKLLHQHLVTCAPTPAQHAAVAALEHRDRLVDEAMEVFGDRRRLALERLEDLPAVSAVPPDGAFYLFLDVRRYTGDGVDSLALAEALLDRQDLVLVPGSGFGPGGEGFLRLAYAAGREELEEAFDRLEAFFAAREPV